MSNDLKKLCETLNYQFKDINLLQAALTHRSYGQQNNERIEFLGDSILNFVIAETLFNKFVNAKEGELSRLRSSLVKEETLAVLARSLQLGEYMRLGSGEMKTGGFRRDSILSDTLEAVIAAIYLDSNFKTTRKFILSLYAEKLDEINATTQLKDAKTQLQELLQSSKHSLPHYDLVAMKGQLHQQTFIIKCTVSGFDIEAIGQGSSRRKAEQEAASEFLKQLE